MISILKAHGKEMYGVLLSFIVLPSIPAHLMVLSTKIHG
jgi:hypothetical protein